MSALRGCLKAIRAVDGLWAVVLFCFVMAWFCLRIPGWHLRIASYTIDPLSSIVYSEAPNNGQTSSP
jgi:hypothetical protein